MKGPRCDRILAGMTFAVILAALFNVIAKGGDLTAVPTGASPAGQASTETSSAPTIAHQNLLFLPRPPMVDSDLRLAVANMDVLLKSSSDPQDTTRKGCL
jgi:hypothetical protein